MESIPGKLLFYSPHRSAGTERIGIPIGIVHSKELKNEQNPKWFLKNSRLSSSFYIKKKIQKMQVFSYIGWESRKRTGFCTHSEIRFEIPLSLTAENVLVAILVVIHSSLDFSATKYQTATDCGIIFIFSWEKIDEICKIVPWKILNSPKIKK